MSDAELVRRCLVGEREAFGALMERHWSGVRAALSRMLSDPAEAEDVTQEAFLQAYLSLERLRELERFGGWVYGIAVNLARMRLRRRPGWLSWEDLAGGVRAVGFTAASANTVPVEVAVETRELHRRVRAAVAGLPQADREVVVRYYLEGLSQQELAALLGVSVGAVRVRLHRARGRLRTRLQAEFGPLPSPEEAKAMIDVVVHDVLVHVVEPEGENARPIGHRIALLKERDGERLLPIWIGDFEGDALALQLGGENLPRPLTFDLMVKLLGIGGVQIESVAVSELREETYYAVIRATVAGQTHEIDARPSDALNLALRTGVPIQVSAEVLGRTGGVAAAGIPAFIEECIARSPRAEWVTPEPRHWRSLVEMGVLAMHAKRKP
jgi:RNA polymerase sigma factor (sigma-70 family)